MPTTSRTLESVLASLQTQPDHRSRGGRLWRMVEGELQFVCGVALALLTAALALVLTTWATAQVASIPALHDYVVAVSVPWLAICGATLMSIAVRLALEPRSASAIALTAVAAAAYPLAWLGRKWVVDGWPPLANGVDAIGWEVRARATDLTASGLGLSGYLIAEGLVCTAGGLLLCHLYLRDGSERDA